METSDGALVGLLVALQRPDLVRRLVLIGTQVNPQGLPPEVIEMMKLDKMPDMLPPMLQQMYAAVSPDGPDHWDVVIDKMWQLMRTEPNIDLSELAKVQAPTLVIVADHDFPSVEHSAQCGDRYPTLSWRSCPVPPRASNGEARGGGAVSCSTSFARRLGEAPTPTDNRRSAAGGAI